MNRDSVVFFTVLGGGEDREFLLGSVEHHARLGRHLVLDVDPLAKPIRGLPKSVMWLHEPIYCSGSWKTFRLASALDRARDLAERVMLGAEFAVQLDSDEYYDVDRLGGLLVREVLPKAFVFHTIHWRGGRPLRFGASEWHMRAWDLRATVRFERNLAWPAHPKYNGNPEHHPLAIVKSPDVQIVRPLDPIHYHIHYELGNKRNFTETAETTIDGWPDGSLVPDACPMPELLERWSKTGALPSDVFSI